MVIDMGMGPGIVVNHKKKQRKEMMKDIDMDVNQFMKDFEETKKAATAFDDSASQMSGLTNDSKIAAEINSAFTKGSTKTKAEMLLWQK